MIYLASFGASDAISLQRITHGAGEISELFEIIEIHLNGVSGFNQVKPVTAPSHVALHCAPTGYIHRHSRSLTPAAHVLYRHPTILRRPHRHDASRRFDFVVTGGQSPEMSESDRHPNGAMQAAVQVADVVEEYHTRHTIRLSRLEQIRANHRLVPARFAGHGGAERIVLGTQKIAPLPRRAGKFRQTFHHHPRRLTGGMGIDYLDALNGVTHGTRAGYE